MEKFAVGPYKDPLVQELVELKSKTNAKTSKLINDIIHYKKMLNGWPSKYNSQKGTITKPITNSALQVLPQIISDFSEVANEWRAIIDAQFNSYMKRIERQRAKAQSKAAITPAPEGGADLSKQIQASSRAAEYFLITEASNPLSRFFTKLFTPGIGFDTDAARIRKLRISLLNFVADINKSLKQLQKQIVESDSDSIFSAHQMLVKAENDYVFLSSAIQAAKQANAPAPPKVIDFATNPAIHECIAAVEDIESHSNSFQGMPHMSELRNAAKPIRIAINSKNGNEILKFAAPFLALYREVVKYVSLNKGIAEQSSFAAINHAATYDGLEPALDANDQLQVIAQNLLGKWHHKIWPFDKTSAFRLDIYETAKDARKLANDIMNLLEASFDIEALEPLVVELGNCLFALKNNMAVLLHAIKEVDEVDVAPKEKDDFAKILKSKQLRDLVNKYVA